MKLLLAVTLILSLPILELYLLMHSSAYFGVNQTLLFIVVSALCGIFVLRFQGASNIKKMRLTLSQGGLPTGALFESVFILVGGIALLLPGFISDAVGVMLLIPLVRRYMLLMFFRRLI
ncbi:FxsA family protein [Spartinivicinus ruber]|uniref:FxsA family protein n=1 Tax=Spartinivicinus ruber TaxID=2683272 RepID=UPI001E2DE6BB|nr:FxsA family protein [Spartinivicinus ruber]